MSQYMLINYKIGMCIRLYGVHQLNLTELLHLLFAYLHASKAPPITASSVETLILNVYFFSGSIMKLKIK